MRKFVIPATICTLVLVGAVLLLLPLEDAMAVHTTLSANINKQDRYLIFVTGANSTTAVTDVVIIPQKAGQSLKVAITSTIIDGAGGFSANATFETTGAGSADVTADGTLKTLGEGLGLQIKNMIANSEHVISIIIGEDAE